MLTPNRAKHDEDAAAFERDGIEVIEGDLRDQPLLETLVVGRQLIFNLSGQSGAVRSMEDPWTDLDVNVRGNLVLLEALRARNPGAKVVFAGSRLQYGHVDHLPAGEDAPQTALCLHAIHKQTVEKYFDLYSRLFGIRYSVARITNPYGPGQPSSRTAYGVINRMIHLAIADRALTSTATACSCGTTCTSMTWWRRWSRWRRRLPPTGVPTTSAAAKAPSWSIWRSRSSRLPDGGRIEHVAWPPLAQQVETGDFIADIGRIQHELGWRPCDRASRRPRRDRRVLSADGRGVMQRPHGSSYLRMRSWLAAPKKWCSISCAICLRDLNRWWRASTRPVRSAKRFAAPACRSRCWA